ncbi:MAG TPA: DUF58 domain-containing protein [Rubrivivax sp.]
MTSAALPLPARARWSLGRRVRSWFENRLPLTDSWTLNQRNIYIVPTPGGWAFAGMIVLLLLGSINYQLNLGYLLTFLLAGCALASMHMTHATLRGLTLRMRPVTPVHAGEAALLEVVITNPGAERHGIGLAFSDGARFGRSHAWIDVPALGQQTARLAMVPAARGWHGLPTVRAETRFPIGLFRAWTVWRPAARVLAYPRPETPPAPLAPSRHAHGEAAAVRRHEGSELEGVRAWRRGDSLRQVLWKKVARTGELVSRDTSTTVSPELWLDWDSARTPSGAVEDRLARLAAWVLVADRSGSAYGLQLPGAEFAPGQGETHRRQLLETLALWA